MRKPCSEGGISRDLGQGMGWDSVQASSQLAPGLICVPRDDREIQRGGQEVGKSQHHPGI